MGLWKGSFRHRVEIERYVGTLGLRDRRHHPRFRERLGEHLSRWAEDRIGRRELLIARWRGGTARRGSNRGFAPQEPASADGLKRLRRHHRPSEDMPLSSMGQWPNDEVGADAADCANAIPSRPAGRRIGGEHDARAHGSVPCRRRPRSEVSGASRYASAVHASVAIPGPELRYHFQRDTPLTSSRESDYANA